MVTPPRSCRLVVLLFLFLKLLIIIEKPGPSDSLAVSDGGSSTPGLTGAESSFSRSAPIMSLPIPSRMLPLRPSVPPKIMRYASCGSHRQREGNHRSVFVWSILDRRAWSIPQEEISVSQDIWNRFSRLTRDQAAHDTEMCSLNENNPFRSA